MVSFRVCAFLTNAYTYTLSPQSGIFAFMDNDFFEIFVVYKKLV